MRKCTKCKEHFNGDKYQRVCDDCLEAEAMALDAAFASMSGISTLEDEESLAYFDRYIAGDRK
jgi:hypothetical protein